MADKELTDLTAATSVDGTEFAYIVDSAGTLDRKITIANLFGTALTALRSVFTPASASGPASLDLAEDTDNGAHKITLKGQSSLAANRTLTLPDADGTLLTSETASGAYVSSAGGSAIAPAVGTVGLTLTPGSGQTANSLEAKDTADTVRLVVDPSGRIGIRTTTPSARLHLNESTTATSGSTNYGSILTQTVNPGSAQSGVFVTAQVNANYTSAQASTADVIALRGSAVSSGARPNVLCGIDGTVNYTGTDLGGTQSAYGARFQSQNTGGGYVNHMIGWKVNSPSITNGSTVGNVYGGYIADVNIAGASIYSALHIEGDGANNAITFGNGSSSRNAAIYSAASGIITTDARWYLPAGSLALPSLAFSGDPDTGLWNSAANGLQLVAGGVAQITLDGSVNILRTLAIANAVNVTFGTGTGTKLGTNTTQKIGFWNTTPVVQPTGIVDADGTLADITTKFNSLLAKLESVGLLAAA